MNIQHYKGFISNPAATGREIIQCFPKGSLREDYGVKRQAECKTGALVAIPLNQKPDNVFPSLL
ncbi:MAG: hypothetical protein WBG58_18305 [Ignavibacteriaceae bacterium]|jgi:hypothetical protein